MNTTENARPTLAIPVVLSGMANVFLGLSSLYWRELSDVSAITLVAYRVILSVVILFLLISLFRPLSQIKCITLKLIGLHCIASLLIAMNWATFIWSSINGYFFESGLGYLLAPCLSIALGAILYRESMPVGKIMLTACALSTAVTLIIFMKSASHLTYLTIATTWGFYTYIKKFTPLNAINGLFIETLFLTSALIVAIALFNLPIENPTSSPHARIN